MFHFRDMNRKMWNATKNEIPRYQIEREHMRIIECAVDDMFEDFDVRSAKLYEALDYFEKQSTSTWGFTLFRQGLENWETIKLKEGLRLIRQQLHNGVN